MMDIECCQSFSRRSEYRYILKMSWLVVHSNIRIIKLGFLLEMGEFLYNSPLVKYILMQNQNSNKDYDLQIKQYIKVNFRCRLNTSSATREICRLCYAQMKTHCLKILQWKVEVVILTCCVAILIYFNFWSLSVNCWSLFCSFTDWSYL